MVLTSIRLVEWKFFNSMNIFFNISDGNIFQNICMCILCIFKVYIAHHYCIAWKTLPISTELNF